MARKFYVAELTRRPDVRETVEQRAAAWRARLERDGFACGPVVARHGRRQAYAEFEVPQDAPVWRSAAA